MALPSSLSCPFFIGESHEFGVAILALQAARRLHQGVKFFRQAQQGKNAIT
jgi:hypothetical protein